MRRLSEWRNVAEFIDGISIAHASTSSASSLPHVAVVAPALDHERLWLTTRSDSAMCRNLAENPRIAVVWQGNGAETYVWADVTLRDDQETKSRIWHSRLFPFDLGAFYADENDHGWLVAELHPVRATVMVQTGAGLERRAWSRTSPGSSLDQ